MAIKRYAILFVIGPPITFVLFTGAATQKDSFSNTVSTQEEREAIKISTVHQEEAEDGIVERSNRAVMPEIRKKMSQQDRSEKGLIDEKREADVTRLVDQARLIQAVNHTKAAKKLTHQTYGNNRATQNIAQMTKTVESTVKVQQMNRSVQAAKNARAVAAARRY